MDYDEQIMRAQKNQAPVADPYRLLRRNMDLWSGFLVALALTLFAGGMSLLGVVAYVALKSLGVIHG